MTRGHARSLAVSEHATACMLCATTAQCPPSNHAVHAAANHECNRREAWNQLTQSLGNQGTPNFGTARAVHHDCSPAHHAVHAGLELVVALGFGDGLAGQLPEPQQHALCGGQRGAAGDSRGHSGGSVVARVRGGQADAASCLPQTRRTGYAKRCTRGMALVGTGDKYDHCLRCP